MRLELVTKPAVTGRIELDQLDLSEHYIGAEVGGYPQRYMLRRDGYQHGKFRWAAPREFCEGNSMSKGDRSTLKEAIAGVLDGSSEINGLPGEVVVFTTAKELFLWALGEENTR